jgi:hypothetical protein
MPKAKTDRREDPIHYFSWLIAVLVLIFWIGQAVSCNTKLP